MLTTLFLITLTFAATSDNSLNEKFKTKDILTHIISSSIIDESCKEAFYSLITLRNASLRMHRLSFRTHECSFVRIYRNSLLLSTDFRVESDWNEIHRLLLFQWIRWSSLWKVCIRGRSVLRMDTFDRRSAPPVHTEKRLVEEGNVEVRVKESEQNLIVPEMVMKVPAVVSVWPIRNCTTVSVSSSEVKGVTMRVSSTDVMIGTSVEYSPAKSLSWRSTPEKSIPSMKRND